MIGNRYTMLFGSSRPSVVPFLTAGFPDKQVFLETASAVFEAGAGALEIGMPFSDPLADGPAIQLSSQTALAHGVTIGHCLEYASAIRSRWGKPIYLMGYLNPILKYDAEKFASEAAYAGVSGTIIPDLPIEEAGEWRRLSRLAALENVFLIAPTSPESRVRMIDRLSTTFSYCVSVAGVTGARRDVSKQTLSYLRRVRRVAEKPCVVGFGISQPSHIRSLSGLADGYVVGSALVPLLAEGTKSSRSKKVAKLVEALVRAASAAS